VRTQGQGHFSLRPRSEERQRDEEKGAPPVGYPVKVTPEAQNWKLIVAYDGTDFRGWQVQPEQTTVQGELQAALGRVTGESPLPQGSGRTDAGVHALAQVASFALQAGIPPENLILALNRTLSESIRIISAQHMPANFHARHSTVAKTYEYRVFVERTDAPGQTVPRRFWRATFIRTPGRCPWPP
jgi:tRNA pseudouridine(38-40) synthase